MELKKKRWFILFFSCLVILCVGSLYAWSVFASGMQVYLSEITNTKIISLSIVFTVANSVGPITMISGGVINDKYGPKPILIVGGILFGLGMIGAGFSKSVGMLIITYGLGVGLACGMVYGTIVSNTIKFFPDKKGFAGGITTACYGGSSFLVPIIASKLLDHMTITSAFKVLGAIMMVVICLSSFIIEKCPVDFSTQLGLETKKAVSSKEYTYKEMLKQKEFYIMLMILTCGAFSGMMIISQASSIGQIMMHFDVKKASLLVSIIAFFNMSGRLVAGTLSDRLGIIKTLKICFVGTILGSILLYICKSDTIFYIGVSLIGLCFGSIMGIYPSFTAKAFGTRNNSVNYGIMFIGFALAGFLGPIIMNNIYIHFGMYQLSFLVCAVLAFVGEILVFVYGDDKV